MLKKTLTYGFGYGLQLKAEVFQGQTFGYGRRWKLCLRSNTVLFSMKIVIFHQFHQKINNLYLVELKIINKSNYCHLSYVLCFLKWMFLTLGNIHFKRTFQTTTKCNNINHFWSQFYEILVVLKYHKRLWANIFDTDICRSITIKKRPNIPL